MKAIIIKKREVNDMKKLWKMVFILSSVISLIAAAVGHLRWG
ncbi:MAG: hypothetical protein PWP09_1739 [Thermotogota bacterium]|nr:hypothetical protein [Thermotogota bacterium]